MSTPSGSNAERASPAGIHGEDQGALDENCFLTSVKLEGEVPCTDKYPFSLAAVLALDSLTFHPSVTFIVGENGCGKSTLLEAIAIAWGFNAEGGSQNFNFTSRSSHSDLHKFLCGIGVIH